VLEEISLSCNFCFYTKIEITGNFWNKNSVTRLSSRKKIECLYGVEYVGVWWVFVFYLAICHDQLEQKSYLSL